MYINHRRYLFVFTNIILTFLFTNLLFWKYNNYTFLTNNVVLILKHISPLLKQYFISTLSNNYKISQTVCLLCIHILIEKFFMCITHGRQKQ